jgi:hypothetical protein
MVAGCRHAQSRVERPTAPSRWLHASRPPAATGQRAAFSIPFCRRTLSSRAAGRAACCSISQGSVGDPVPQKHDTDDPASAPGHPLGAGLAATDARASTRSCFGPVRTHCSIGWPERRAAAASPRSRPRESPNPGARGLRSFLLAATRSAGCVGACTSASRPARRADSDPGPASGSFGRHVASCGRGRETRARDPVA